MKIRFFFQKKTSRNQEDLKLIRFILKSFGYKLNDIYIFNQALTHKSLSNLDKNSHSNERLEFLGDSILDSVVAEYLYKKFPDSNEGYLTQIKSKIVNRKTLSEIAETMGLRSYIKYKKGRSINLNSLEGNALEALIGAIYLDGGYEACKKTINHHILRNYVDLNKIIEEDVDFKSKLFIWTQKNRLTINYITVNESFTDGNWNYEIQVEINNVKYGIGKANSKKNAEQLASKETLILMGEF